MGSPSRREPDGDGVAIVVAGVTTCRGAEESSVQGEGRQGNRSNLMRLREMRRGQRARSGNWRADYLETRTSGSEGVDGKGPQERYLTSRLSYLVYLFKDDERKGRIQGPWLLSSYAEEGSAKHY